MPAFLIKNFSSHFASNNKFAPISCNGSLMLGIVPLKMLYDDAPKNAIFWHCYRTPKTFANFYSEQSSAASPRTGQPVHLKQVAHSLVGEAIVPFPVEQLL